QFGVSLSFSREAVALETAGGIAYARHLLGDAPFLLLSADIVTDYPLARLCDAATALARDRQRQAHLVVVPNPPYHPVGDFGLSPAGLIDPDAPDRLCYANLMVLKPELVAEVATGATAPLGPILKAAARQGRISGERFDGGWFNVGTPDELVMASAAVHR
ncbi:MAG: nucleotidyltransferase family protein, partial [Burkholderiales bacterium]|nr:nucleotidyltransferase family protein [Burkholderiales bacterium]